MNEDFPAPLKGLINAYRKGAIITQRICRSAGNLSSTRLLDTVEPAQALEKSLARCEVRLKDGYTQSLSALGRRFFVALANDTICTSRLQALTINLLDHVMNLDDYMDDPEGFDLGSFRYVQRESERSCEQTLDTLNSLHQRLVQASLQRHQVPASTDSSQIHTSSDDPVLPGASITSTNLNLASNVATLQTKSNEERPSPKANASYHSSSIPDPLLGSPSKQIPFPASTPVIRKEIPRKPIIPEQPVVKLISREEVDRQIAFNEELLEKRRTSRITFRQDLGNIQHNLTEPASSGDSIIPVPRETSSALNISTSSARTSHSTLSLPPNREDGISSSSLSYSPKDSAASFARRDTLAPIRLNSNASQRRESRTSSDTGSMTHPRQDSSPTQNSEILLFGPLESPSLSEGRQSMVEDHGTFNETFKVSGYGDGIEPGIEVVYQPQRVPDSGKMLVDEEYKQPAPAISLQSVYCNITHDASFYRYGGFCDGAKMLLRGERGAMKLDKKPGYTGTTYMKCINCAYEVDSTKYYKDEALDKSGIYRSGDAHFRLKFLCKSHLRSKRPSDPDTYACIFCVEDNRTIDDHDATVFFSADQLLRHVQKHNRPLRHIEGITIIYGHHANALDFELHFPTMDVKTNPFADISLRLASLPTGHALVDHRDHARGFRERDPENNHTLQFAIGARIIGITYPTRFNGTWCSGFHNGVKALFPANTVQLHQPPKDAVTMNTKSSLTATAKWDHKPKDVNSGWLSFSKKDRLIHVGFPFQDMWCWTGQNSKGKWGLFPACFVEGLMEMERAPPGGMAPLIGQSGFGSLSVGSLGSVGETSPHRWGSFSKVPSLHFRRGTSASQSSTGSSGDAMSPP